MWFNELKKEMNILLFVDFESMVKGYPSCRESKPWRVRVWCFDQCPGIPVPQKEDIRLADS